MKNYKELDSKRFQLNQENIKKNKELMNRRQTKDRLYKRIFRWFTPSQDKLMKEVITNWSLIVFPLIMFIVVTMSTNNIDEWSYNSLGWAAMFVLISFLGFVVAIIYKLLLKYRKHRGVYWPTHTRRPKTNGSESIEG